MILRNSCECRWRFTKICERRRRKSWFFFFFFASDDERWHRSWIVPMDNSWLEFELHAYILYRVEFTAIISTFHNEVAPTISANTPVCEHYRKCITRHRCSKLRVICYMKGQVDNKDSSFLLTKKNADHSKREPHESSDESGRMTLWWISPTN
jgi:hypothetical protein